MNESVMRGNRNEERCLNRPFCAIYMFDRPTIGLTDTRTRIKTKNFEDFHLASQTYRKRLRKILDLRRATTAFRCYPSLTYTDVTPHVISSFRLPLISTDRSLVDQISRLSILFFFLSLQHTSRSFND